LNKLYVKISKFLSYILRHNPKKFGIQLDPRGYADLGAVLNILNERFTNVEIDKNLIHDLIRKSDKKRFEINERGIRAFYGHSIDKKISMTETKNPPEKLYHGTTSWSYKNIKKEGLKSKGRQYVHLSQDLKTARKVGKRRTNNPLILEINVNRALKDGVKFYKSGDMYLADAIPPKYLNKLKS
jgi:putative RNA 2'-phosphotransferase